MKRKRINRKINTKVSVFKKQSFVMFILSFVTLFLIFSYSFLLFLSVTHAHAISSNKEELVKLITENSSLNSDYLTKKIAVVSKNKTKMVKVNKVIYLRSIPTNFAFNR